MSLRNKLFHLYSQRFNYNELKETYEVILKPGTYSFECVGASGGDEITSFTPSTVMKFGCGAKTFGILTLKELTTFYVYVGGAGGNGNKVAKKTPGGWNGGGQGGIGAYNKQTNQTSSGGGGGGATDIRLIRGININDPLEEESLRSRIMVAAGGGGRNFQSGGHGGEIFGGDARINPHYEKTNQSIKGGSQTSGGGFGFGMDGIDKDEWKVLGAEGNGGGGGGWWGGYASQEKNKENTNAAGGGGSSYISGMVGCQEHQKYVFTSTFMRGGDKTKHVGNGYAIITQLIPATVCRANSEAFDFFLLGTIFFTLK